MIRRLALCIFATSSFLTARAQEWTSIDAPSLCTSTPSTLQPLPLLDGRHLRIDESGSRQEFSSRGASLTLVTFQQLLEENARALGAHLEVVRQGASILVRGDAAALQSARALSDELERAGRSLEIALSIRLATPAADGQSAAELAFERSVRSGGSCFVGWRETRNFVATFDVEVAADSGSAEPVIGEAFAGRSLHLSAARIDGGKRVFVWGFLDLSDLVEVGRFDPDTVDLGIIEEPLVRSAQVCFSGVCDPQGMLVVDLAGNGLGSPAYKLEIRARATVDAADPALTEGWKVLDFGFLSFAPPVLERASHISENPPAGRAEGIRTSETFAPVLPSSIVSALEAQRGSPPARGGQRTPLFWSDTLLLVPRAEAGLQREAARLIAAHEAERARTGQIEVRYGTLRVSFPVTVLCKGRALVGSETTRLTDYSLELAPEIWMPSPRVETHFDGLCLDVEANGRAAECALWVAESAIPAEASRQDARIGKLQLTARALRTTSLALDAGADERLALEELKRGAGAASGASVFVRYRVP